MAADEAARAFACGRGPQQVAAEQMGTGITGLSASDVSKLASDKRHESAAFNASLRAVHRVYDTASRMCIVFVAGDDMHGRVGS